MNNMQGEDGGLPPHHRQCAWTHQGDTESDRIHYDGQLGWLLNHQY